MFVNEIWSAVAMQCVWDSVQEGRAEGGSSDGEQHGGRIKPPSPPPNVQRKLYKFKYVGPTPVTGDDSETPSLPVGGHRKRRRWKNRTGKWDFVPVLAP